MNLFSEHQLAHRYLAGRITKFVFRWAILLGIGFIMLYPILFMASNAVRAVEDTYDPTVIWIPKHFSFESFQVSIQMLDYLHSVLRTLRILVPSVALQLVSVLMAGYGFARFSFQGKNILFALLIFTIIVPSQTYIIPQYANLRFFDLFGLGQLARIFTGEPLTFNLLNTDWCFYIPALFGFGIRSGLYIFILRQFFRNMPKELEDAAMIDGCGPIKTFVKIMVPNVIPALVTVLVFSVVWYWNDYMLPSMFLNNDQPLAVKLTMVKTILGAKEQNSMGAINAVDMKLMRDAIFAASCLLVIAPLVVFYTAMQRYFTEGIERSGIVG